MTNTERRIEELKREEGKKLNIVCNRCNKEYPITELSNLDYARIINVKTGESLQRGIKVGTYRVMDIMKLPCGCIDSHWVFITNNKGGERMTKKKKRTEEITIPDSLFFYINEALEEYLNKNLMGKDLEKVEIIPGKDFNSYKMKFYYSEI